MTTTTKNNNNNNNSNKKQQQKEWQLLTLNLLNCVHSDQGLLLAVCYPVPDAMKQIYVIFAIVRCHQLMVCLVASV